MTTPNLTDAEREARAELLLRVPALQSDLGRELLGCYEAAIRTERDTAWRAAIEAVRKQEEGSHIGACQSPGECEGCFQLQAVEDWNAALSALADRMGVTPNE